MDARCVPARPPGTVSERVTLGSRCPAFREVSFLGAALLALGLLTLRVARKVRSSEAQPAPSREAA